MNRQTKGKVHDVHDIFCMNKTNNSVPAGQNYETPGIPPTPFPGDCEETVLKRMHPMFWLGEIGVTAV